MRSSHGHFTASLTTVPAWIVGHCQSAPKSRRSLPLEDDDAGIEHDVLARHVDRRDVGEDAADEARPAR